MGGVTQGFRIAGEEPLRYPGDLAGAGADAADAADAAKPHLLLEV